LAEVEHSWKQKIQHMD